MTDGCFTIGLARALLAASVLVFGCTPEGSPAVPTLDPVEASASDADDVTVPREQSWIGFVALPGMKLYFGVKLRRDADAGWGGTIDIPAQFVAEAALESIEVDGARVQFRFRPPGAPESMAATFSAAIEGSEARGDLAQGGAEFPVTLWRLEDGERYAVGPKRPQEPQPPFPYEAVAVQFASKDGTKLSGTLTLPEGDGPHPGVVLMSGSGPQDRNEALADHKPFLVLADHLTRRGIAVLRYDDRGVPLSEGKYETATIMDFVDDGLAALTELRKHARIDQGKTGIVGHSQGAVEAAIAGVKSKHVAFVVMMAGFGLTGRELLVLQHKVIFERSGIDAADVDAMVAAHEALLDASKRGVTGEKLKALASTLVDLQLSAMKNQPTPDGAREAMIVQAATSLEAPWFRSVLDLDPVPWLRRLKRPVLVLIGDKDTQVPVEANMPAIEQALKRANNRDVTLQTMQGLNHLFQRAEKGTPDEYAEIEETIAPEALQLVTDWILARTK